jgi:hypothetical protein
MSVCSPYREDAASVYHRDGGGHECACKCVPVGGGCGAYVHIHWYTSRSKQSGNERPGTRRPAKVVVGAVSDLAGGVLRTRNGPTLNRRTSPRVCMRIHDSP